MLKYYANKGGGRFFIITFSWLAVSRSESASVSSIILVPIDRRWRVSKVVQPVAEPHRA
jgi:hypothetical protein